MCILAVCSAGTKDVPAEREGNLCVSEVERRIFHVFEEPLFFDVVDFYAVDIGIILRQ